MPGMGGCSMWHSTGASCPAGRPRKLPPARRLTLLKIRSAPLRQAYNDPVAPDLCWSWPRSPGSTTAMSKDRQDSLSCDLTPPRYNPLEPGKDGQRGANSKHMDISILLISGSTRDGSTLSLIHISEPTRRTPISYA